jgi:hypothetical protein
MVPRTLADVASLKTYYESLPLKTDQAPLVLGERAQVEPHRRGKHGLPSAIMP